MLTKASASTVSGAVRNESISKRDAPIEAHPASTTAADAAATTAAARCSDVVNGKGMVGLLV
ncbi:hypothetical protein GCM10009079_04010 [Ralstonia mannitolilytica]